MQAGPTRARARTRRRAERPRRRRTPRAASATASAGRPARTRPCLASLRRRQSGWSPAAAGRISVQRRMRASVTGTPAVMRPARAQTTPTGRRRDCRRRGPARASCRHGPAWRVARRLADRPTPLLPPPRRRRTCSTGLRSPWMRTLGRRACQRAVLRRLHGAPTPRPPSLHPPCPTAQRAPAGGAARRSRSCACRRARSRRRPASGAAAAWASSRRGWRRSRSAGRPAAPCRARRARRAARARPRRPPAAAGPAAVRRGPARAPAAQHGPQAQAGASALGRTGRPA